MDEESALAIGGYRFTAKNLIVIGLILVGLFLAYVIFHKKPAAATASADNAATPTGSTGTGGTEVTTDPSAIGSLQTQLEATQQSNLATQQAVSGLSGLGTQLTGISGQLTGIAGTQTAQGSTLATINTNANSAARDAAGARTDSSIALNGVNKLLAGKGFSTASPMYTDVAHIGAAGLGI